MTSVMHIMYTLRSNHIISSEIPKIWYLVPGCDYNLYGEPLRALVVVFLLVVVIVVYRVGAVIAELAADGSERQASPLPGGRTAVPFP